MSEQFILCQDDFGNYEIRYDDKIFHFLWEVAPILNKQQATIEAKNEYQQVLEAKIRRLKNRIKILEKAEGWQN